MKNVVYGLASLFLCWFLGCVSSKPSKTETFNEDELAVVRAFERWRDAILQGDLKTAYTLIASTSVIKANFPTPKDFEEGFKQWGKSWQAYLEDTVPDHVKVEGVTASFALLKRRVARLSALTMVVEEGMWKVENFSPPPRR